MTAAHPQCPRRSHPLRQDRVLQAPEPDVGGRPRRSEVDQGDVDALATADDDSPGARRRRHGGREIELRRRSWWLVVGQEAAEAVYQRRSLGRTAYFDGRRDCRRNIITTHHTTPRMLKRPTAICEVTVVESEQLDY